MSLNDRILAGQSMIVDNVSFKDYAEDVVALTGNSTAIAVKNKSDIHMDFNLHLNPAPPSEARLIGDLFSTFMLAIYRGGVNQYKSLLEDLPRYDSSAGYSFSWSLTEANFPKLDDLQKQYLLELNSPIYKYYGQTFAHNFDYIIDYFKPICVVNSAQIIDETTQNQANQGSNATGDLILTATIKAFNGVFDPINNKNPNQIIDGPDNTVLKWREVPDFGTLPIPWSSQPLASLIPEPEWSEIKNTILSPTGLTPETPIQIPKTALMLDPSKRYEFYIQITDRLSTVTSSIYTIVNTPCFFWNNELFVFMNHPFFTDGWHTFIQYTDPTTSKEETIGVLHVEKELFYIPGDSIDFTGGYFPAYYVDTDTSIMIELPISKSDYLRPQLQVSILNGLSFFANGTSRSITLGSHSVSQAEFKNNRIQLTIQDVELGALRTVFGSRPRQLFCSLSCVLNCI